MLNVAWKIGLVAVVRFFFFALHLHYSIQALACNNRIYQFILKTYLQIFGYTNSTEEQETNRAKTAVCDTLLYKYDNMHAYACTDTHTHTETNEYL